MYRVISTGVIVNMRKFGSGDRVLCIVSNVGEYIEIFSKGSSRNFRFATHCNLGSIVEVVYVRKGSSNFLSEIRTIQALDIVGLDFDDRVSIMFMFEFLYRMCKSGYAHQEMYKVFLEFSALSVSSIKFSAIFTVLKIILIEGFFDSNELKKILGDNFFQLFVNLINSSEELEARNIPFGDMIAEISPNAVYFNMLKSIKSYIERKIDIKLGSLDLYFV